MILEVGLLQPDIREWLFRIRVALLLGLRPICSSVTCQRRGATLSRLMTVRLCLRELPVAFRVISGVLAADMITRGSVRNVWLFLYRFT